MESILERKGQTGYFARKAEGQFSLLSPLFFSFVVEKMRNPCVKDKYKIKKEMGNLC